MTKEYYLGLDIGTESVGWAVTDEHYNLIRKKGKDLWGVRRFSEADTAAERRVNRSNRRKTDRKRARLQILREIFEEEVNKVDKQFYLRMDESKFWEEDKKVNGKYSLFNDENYNDEKYYEDYPTIFHLRKELMETKTKKDIRLYFLAINQMMKRRGHFLFEGMEFNESSNEEEYKLALIRQINDLINEDIEKSVIDEVFEVLYKSNETKNDRKREIKNIISKLEYSKDITKTLTGLFDMLVSAKCKVASLVQDEAIKQKLKEDSKEDIEFTNENFDDEVEYYASELPERYELIVLLKSIYSMIILKDILKEHKYISDAQVARFEKHKMDLANLKDLIRKYNEKEYKKIFSDKKEEQGYVAYLGYFRDKNIKEPVKKCSYKEFATRLKKVLDSCDKEDEVYKSIIADLDNEKLLPKQIVSTNSVIPHQLHLQELKLILNNLVRDYPYFSKTDENGISYAEKIELLFKFRIPYYVGPLNPAHKNLPHSNTWIVKNKGFENEKIRPWNFDKIVDKHACEVEFIQRMTNQCTYLKNEKVLPKSSLLYSEFTLLNELNILKVNEKRINYETKQKLIEDIFLKGKKGTIKNITKVLIANNLIDKDEDVNISGIDVEIKSSLKSRRDKDKIFGDTISDEIFEEIIKMVTIHNDKAMLSSKIKELVPKIDEKQLKQTLALKYKDWGRLSEKFLNGIEGVNRETGEINTIIGFLRMGKENLQELLSSKYSFSDLIFQENGDEKVDKISYDLVDGLYTSPAVKKMIWQVLKISEEIIKVMGYDPKKIFIEMARENGKKEKKESRKNKLIELYKNAKKDIEKFGIVRNWQEELNKKDESEYRSKLLFLYYTQLGRCMYSGEEISLGQLFNKNLYDIDHIIPRKLKKDDSIINNLVLVKKTINQHDKKDKYPIPENIRNNIAVTNLWKFLLEKGFIGKEKYNRLIRRSQLTDKEKGEFINRQLVETRQSTKLVADLFKQIFDKNTTRVVYVKAELASEYRHKENLLKCRDINDLHHAHDAYLNIVVGNGWDTKFTSNGYEFVKQHKEYSLNHIFEREIKNRKGDIIWNPNVDKERVRKIISKPSVLYTVESYEEKGKLYDATISGKKDIKKGTKYLPLKKDERLRDVNKYGGYVNLSIAYYFLVEHEKKNEKIRTFEFMPVYLAKQTEKDTHVLLDYCTSELGLKNPKIIIRKILKKSRVRIDGFEYLLNGKTSEAISLESAVQKFFSIDESRKFKTILDTINKSKEYKKDLFKDMDREMLIDTLKCIDSAIRSKLFIKRKNNPLVKLNALDNIKSLSNAEIAELVAELINIVKCRPVVANLTKIDGSSQSGKMRINKNISSIDECILINQSITGIYTNEVNLKTWDGEQL